MKKKIAALTGGGDCPGINDTLYAISSTARKMGYEVVALRNGWEGAIENLEVPLYEHMLKDSVGVSGTIIGTSRINPFKEGEDKSKNILENFEKQNIHALIAVGGEDTLGVACKLLKYYPSIIGVPKTMDFDLQSYSLGFNSAVEKAREDIEKLRTTAESHGRIFVYEVFGRNVGWVALKSGVTSDADVILVPEVDADLDMVCRVLKEKYESRQSLDPFKKGYGIVVVAEGINISTETSEKDNFGHPKLKGAGERIASKIEELLHSKYGVKCEVRYVVSSHLIRGGRSNWYDVDMGLKLGAAAVYLVDQGKYGVAPVDVKDDGMIVTMPIEELLQQKKVSNELVTFYESMGFDFGRKHQPYKPVVEGFKTNIL